MKYETILEVIGHTPEVHIQSLFDPRVEVWMKLERQNPGGSIKDRIALAMIEDAEKKGILSPGGTVIEPTSGNTGIGLSLVCAVKGYKLILVMPESMSIERRKLMSAYGATFELTPRELGMKGAVDKAKELLGRIDNAFMPQQFENEANFEVHAKTTAVEILNDFPGGLDYLITGVGTGGHISGVSEVLKEKYPKLKTFAVEPTASPILSGGKPGPHKIQGIGANFIPKNYHQNTIDGVIEVDDADAYEYARRAAKEEGIFVGISSGASLAAIAKKLPEIEDNAKILTFCYDTGERYLSIEGLFA